MLFYGKSTRNVTCRRELLRDPEDQGMANRFKGADGTQATTGARETSTQDATVTIGVSETPVRRAPSHSRGGYFFFIVAIIGVIAVAFLMYGRGRASLRVRAFPQEAVISFDGKVRGTGEVELRFLKAGWHRVEARLDSVVRERQILVEPGERRVATLELRKGYLVARSPTGRAVVSAESSEEPLGLTPLGPVPLWAGPSILRFSLPGHVDRAETLTIAPDETTLVAVDLTRGQGVLFVDVKPETAGVYLGGDLLGRGPRVLQTVNAGSHHVQIRAPGWTAASESVAVAHGDTARMTVELEPSPTGWLVVTSSPSGAGLTLGDGTALGATPSDSLPLDAGSYRVHVEKDGYIPTALDVGIAAGRATSEHVRLRPEFRVRALAVNSRPPATVLLDGKMVGETPMVVPEVRTGVKHVLTLLSSDGRSWTTDFVASPREREPHRISHDFAP
jgi:hypothetical protein